ncbi:limbic system-associated membrane protein-like [Ptychodera flava]|uniref:limbic system-associated membrane protein-like n=1 Tax=Ptychodera flava TaxID=63121 RepID=UPI003969C9FC
MEKLVFVLLAVLCVSVHGEVLKFATNVTVQAGKNTELVCKTTGIPDFSSSVIYWVRSSDSKTITYKNELSENGDDPEEPGEIPRYSLDINTPNEYAIKITDAKYMDSGKWVCTSGNSEPVWLTVRVPPEITYITDNFFAEKNITKRLRCAATGSPVPVITWTRYKNSLPNGDILFHGEELELINMTSTDRGTYQCVASNVVGTASDTVKVTMNYKPNIIVLKPEVRTRINGRATLVCEYEAYPDVSEVTWLRAGRVVYEDRKLQVDINTNTKISTLAFGRVRSDQYGQYECKVRNLEGISTKTLQFMEGQPEATPSTGRVSGAAALTASLFIMLLSLVAALRL